VNAALIAEVEAAQRPRNPVDHEAARGSLGGSPSSRSSSLNAAHRKEVSLRASGFLLTTKDLDLSSRVDPYRHVTLRTLKLQRLSRGLEAFLPDLEQVGSTGHANREIDGVPDRSSKRTHWLAVDKDFRAGEFGRPHDANHDCVLGARQARDQDESTGSGGYRPSPILHGNTKLGVNRKLRSYSFVRQQLEQVRVTSLLLCGSLLRHSGESHDVFGNRIYDGASSYASTPSLIYDDANRLVTVKDPAFPVASSLRCCAGEFERSNSSRSLSSRPLTMGQAGGREQSPLRARSRSHRGFAPSYPSARSL